MPAMRRGEAVLQIVEHDARRPRRRCIDLDHAADRADRLQQAPEGAEQAEKDQQADEIAGDLARFVEARADRIEDGAQRRGSRSCRAAPSSPSIVAIGASSTGGGASAGSPPSQRIDPADFAETAGRPAGAPSTMPMHQHADDQRVEAGIGHEGDDDLAIEDQRHESRRGSGRPASAPERCAATTAGRDRGQAPCAQSLRCASWRLRDSRCARRRQIGSRNPAGALQRNYGSGITARIAAGGSGLAQQAEQAAAACLVAGADRALSSMASPPSASLTKPPASRTSTMPAAMSQGCRPRSQNSRRAGRRRPRRDRAPPRRAGAHCGARHDRRRVRP